MTLVIAPLTAAALAILYVQLALGVIKIRKGSKVSLGTGDNDALQIAVRSHANLSEWAPIGLLLIVILEFNAAPFWIAAPPAIALVAGRILHPKGLASNSEESLKTRTLGMQLTIYSILALAALNIIWMIFRFFYN